MRKPAFIGGLLILAIGIWLYVAGGVVLAGLGRDYNTASPFTFVQYAYHYSDNRRVAKWLYIAAACASAFLLLPASLWFKKTKPSLHGDARFATTADIEKAGLNGERGVIVGKRKGKYLLFDGPQNILLSAPTRSGKGVAVVIPNLLHWPESVVVLDIKMENWGLTSGYRRKHGQKCYLFNPAASDGRSHRYNPLGYVSSNPGKRIDDLQKIANMLFPDLDGTDPIWTATPRNLFLGIALYLLETPGKLVTLGQTLRETLVEGDGAEYFTRVMADRQKAGQPLSGACVRALNSYVTIASDNTRSGVMSSFRSRLELWMNPIVDAATSANDFDLNELRRQKISIYVGVTPDNLARMAPLVNLFFQQLVDLNTRELPSQNKSLKYTCLLLMDEFTAPGRIGVLSKGISFIAGYGLRAMPIIQSPSQLDEVYGKDAAETFKKNLAMNIVFPPKASDLQTARDISGWLGTTTVKATSKSRSTEIFKRPNKSESVSEQPRPLLLPQEVSSLGKKVELIVLEDHPTIKAVKVQYYSDPMFVDRLKSVAPSLKALGRKFPTKNQLDAAVMNRELEAPVPFLDVDKFQAALAESESSGGHGVANELSFVEKVSRPFSVTDMPRIKDVEFSIDLSGIAAPPVGNRSDEELIKYADKISAEVGFLV